MYLVKTKLPQRLTIVVRESGPWKNFFFSRSLQAALGAAYNESFSNSVPTWQFISSATLQDEPVPYDVSSRALTFCRILRAPSIVGFTSSFLGLTGARPIARLSAHFTAETEKFNGL